MSGCIAASEAVLVVLFVSSADLLVGFEVAFVLPEFRFASYFAHQSAAARSSVDHHLVLSASPPNFLSPADVSPSLLPVSSASPLSSCSLPPAASCVPPPAFASNPRRIVFPLLDHGVTAL